MFTKLSYGRRCLLAALAENDGNSKNELQQLPPSSFTWKIDCESGSSSSSSVNPMKPELGLSYTNISCCLAHSIDKAICSEHVCEETNLSSLITLSSVKEYSYNSEISMIQTERRDISGTSQSTSR